MLIICEDCAKRYNIDDSRIKGNRARFTCRECGHIIIVDKSDLTRRLISASYSPHPHREESGTIDLLKEMEVSAGPSGHEDTPEETVEEAPAEPVKKQPGSLPFSLYLLPGIVTAFLGTSGVLGYLYMAGSAEQGGTPAVFPAMAYLLLGLAWILALAVFFVNARFAAASINNLKKELLGFVRGEQEAVISSSGPREVRELAAVLAKVVRSRR